MRKGKEKPLKSLVYSSLTGHILQESLRTSPAGFLNNNIVSFDHLSGDLTRVKEEEKTGYELLSDEMNVVNFN